jgi:hypothetical protein
MQLYHFLGKPNLSRQDNLRGIDGEVHLVHLVLLQIYNYNFSHFFVNKQRNNKLPFL